MKSHNVVDAVLEVIDLLCGNTSNTNGETDGQIQYSNVELELDDEGSDG
jgi:hypothetical protein